MGNWSELSRDLLSAIARRLEAAADRAIFSGVCRNWSSLAKSEVNYLPRNPPWLMLTKNLESDERDFVGAYGKERFELELPKSRGSRCIGSTGCWLVMIDVACDMYILNPFSRAKIDLPSLRSLDDFVVNNTEQDAEDLMDLRDYYVCKVILSFPNSQSPGEEDFIAVAIYGLFKLAYTKKGAKSWQTIESIHNRFVDVIFYQDKFYAANLSGMILELNIHCSADEKPNTVPSSDHLTDRLSITKRHRRHLVEFRGLLLQVINLDKDIIETRGFLVLKLDFTTGRWVKLNDLGQHSIFLGYNTGVSLLATSNYTFKPNCIYFSTDKLIHLWVDGKRIEAGNVVVFNLADSIIVPYYSGPYFGSAFTHPVWIVPTSLSQNQ